MRALPLDRVCDASCTRELLYCSENSKLEEYNGRSNFKKYDAGSTIYNHLREYNRESRRATGAGGSTQTLNKARCARYLRRSTPQGVRRSLCKTSKRGSFEQEAHTNTGTKTCQTAIFQYFKARCGRARNFRHTRGCPQI